MNEINIWNHLKHANLNIRELLQIFPNFLIPYTFHLCERINSPSPKITHLAEHPQHSLTLHHCSPLSCGSQWSTLYCSPSAILNKPVPWWYQPVLFSLSSAPSFDAFKVIFIIFQSPTSLGSHKLLFSSSTEGETLGNAYHCHHHQEWHGTGAERLPKALCISFMQENVFPQ